ncbi:XrtX-associated membrane protein [Adhaeribacter terreus]|uniref:XrtX-associated membrane protein n=1 Tax=Adhaeribacter terreus TaxID=529703 RepID=A0ABW0EBE3_9BACT
MRNRILLLFQPEARNFAVPGNALRKALLFGLFTLLFFTGVFTDYIYLYLDRLYYFVFTSLGWFSLLNQSQAEVSSLVTMRSWPTMLTYGLLYTALSFLFLHVYFNKNWKSLIAAGFYFFIFMACTTLILTGKMLPDADWAYKLCRRLIEMVISPLPVILLIAALARAKF